MTFFAPIIRSCYRTVIKPILFRRDPETVHEHATRLGVWLGSNAITRSLVRVMFRYDHAALAQKLWGITFSNPVGLSAGFDKNGFLFNIMDSIGFGFAEVGTVTRYPYEGNPRPRLLRLPKSKGLVVNYGLKNLGVDTVIARLEHIDRRIPQVISIGKTNCAATADRACGMDDYYECLRECVAAEAGDIYEINISCPNAFGGEPFTNAHDLEDLLKCFAGLSIKKPIFIKMPINLQWEEFQTLLDIAVRYGVHAVVIGNLNKNRQDPAIRDDIPHGMKGSVSGKPTEHLVNDLISKTFAYCGGMIKIIGVGGIFSAEDAYEKIRRGATLVELITGMIYEGPQLIGEINRGLAGLLEKDGYKNVGEAVGAYHKVNQVV